MHGKELNVDARAFCPCLSISLSKLKMTLYLHIKNVLTRFLENF